jgi:type IV pilus assembly protein PilY1
MRSMKAFRLGFSRSLGAIAAVACAGGILSTASDAHAQSAGTTNAPLPNVLLLVDTSGSMERMNDDSLPEDTPANTCTPGVQSNPNRWGTLLQALTGSFQPYFSCDDMDRAASRFQAEYAIGGKQPYDSNYDLHYHRPLTGSSATTACANVPFTLPGTSSGVGGANRNEGGGKLTDFPSDSVVSFYNQYVTTANGGALTNSAANVCSFSQANDGQLDAVQDFVRFGLMTFDADTRSGTGVSTAPYLGPAFGTSVLSGAKPAGALYELPFDGTWSYLRTTGNPLGGGVAQGRPAGCATLSPFEVGARNWSAPPWEGRHVAFPDPVGTLLDIETTNDQIQRVLLASRPWGATPIAGQLDDARDYLWYNDYGPYGTQAGYKDLYVSNGCRDQYIILLTDGSPNLDLQPYCNGGVCPYPDAPTIADELYHSKVNGSVVGRNPVKTYVIGFSVNGTNRTPNDGFPTTGLNAFTAPLTCAKWYTNTGANGGNNDPVTMDSVCTSTAPPTGSTAASCCQLNKIALAGSGGPLSPTRIGAFFADSGVDIVTAFSRILGGIAKNATTRTSPGASPSLSISNGTGNDTVAATYVASFIPNARKVWSGEVDRSRVMCSPNSPIPTAQPQKEIEGDSYAVDTALQSKDKRRLFFTVMGTPTGGTKTTIYPATGATATQPIIDSSNSIRPFVTASGGFAPDGAQAYSGQEVFGKDNTLIGTPNFPSALNIDNTTCKRSQYVAPGSQAVTVPPLDNNDCTEVIWDFTTAFASTVNKVVGGYPVFNFNLRCNPSSGGTALASQGKCSISGTACTLAAPTCPSGEACVPECSALGAVFRSTPNVAGPPSGFLRDEGFRTFQSLRADRRAAMYVATTDGVLHAFKALYDPGKLDPTQTADYEMWAFVPPAVLPRLATNYPGGQQVLLDGSPVVKDVVWYRTGNSLVSTQNKNDWHTTLVASLGSGGAGYYALNVSDADCGGLTGSPQACLGPGAFIPETPGDTNILTASVGADATGGRQPGPHFLWQLTDIEQGTSDPAKVSRSNIPYSGGPKTFVSLFGKQTGTPLVTTLQMLDDNDKPIQVGVAVLPGGIDGPPQATGSCPRAVAGGYGTFGAAYRADNLDGTAPPAAASGTVRKWAANCSGANSAVPGRGVTIVRLDNGQIVRHFGRKTQDVPVRLQGYTIDSPFDSPVVGTPVAYPAALGAAAQKIFVGDVDGTLWRLDVSEPCHINPTIGTCGWKAALFADVSAQTSSSPTVKQPIAIAPVVSQSPTGSLVINVATGDQENIVTSTDTNYIMSLEETRPYGYTRLKWYVPLTGGERVTGPMAVFDRTLYFASYQPAASQGGSNVCGTNAYAFIWGLDYFNARTSGTPSSGGDWRWCPFGSASATASGLCGGAYQKNENVTTTQGVTGIVPGVAVSPSLACTSTGGLSEDYGQGITGITPTTYSVNFNFATSQTPPGGLSTAQSARMSQRAGSPRYNASLDAWALVTD